MIQIAIIGCGIVGATIAYELSQVQDVSLLLFDSKKPGEEATGAALGVLMGIISQKKKGRAWQLRQRSLQRYQELIPQLQSLSGVNIPYNKQGILMLQFEGDDRSRWQKLSQIRQSQGWQLELWESDKLAQYCPHIQNDAITGAVYSPQDGQVDPVALTRALVVGSSRNGVNCHFGVKVQKILWRDIAGANRRHCYEIETTTGAFKVDGIVVAAGLGSTPLTASLAQRVDIAPVLGQGIGVKLEQPLGKPHFQPVITGDDVHIVPLGNSKYWVGATVEFSNEQGDVIPSPKLLDELQDKVIAFCPSLAAGKRVKSWWGKRPRPQGQAAPIITQLEGYNNVWLASGHYRNGVLLAPATAEIIREKVVDFINLI